VTQTGFFAIAGPFLLAAACRFSSLQLNSNWYAVLPQSSLKSVIVGVGDAAAAAAAICFLT
jgi:hypothetical protein